jgi:beta-phosphoglucomutase family hydrolase
MSKPQAFIFDLNGTMVDDMDFHGKAWYEIVHDQLGADLSYEEVAKEMYGKNEEVLTRIFGEGKFAPDQMQYLSIKKEKLYQSAFRPHLKLINGLGTFLKAAYDHQVKMAIGSAAIPFNIDFVVNALNLRHYFSAIISADDVAKSKPDPETFTKAAQEMGVEPSACIVFEDAPKGVEAAQNAGMKAVVITTVHKKEHFSSYPNVLTFIKDYTDPWLKNLLNKEIEI